jgi:2-phosphosulfolactate phosphatase
MTRHEILPERLVGATAVVLDVFLATTTLLAILENGARGVYPVGNLEEADAALERLGDGALRGGEQQAQRVEGYDHGPFPDEYSPTVVADRDVIFVTTNGTRAIAECAPAERILVGSLRNAPAVAEHLQVSGTDDICLVCSGASGGFNIEDFLAAAVIMSNMDLDDFRLNDAAWVARDFARHHPDDVREVLRTARAGGWFFRNDRVETFNFVADVGASSLVPEVVEGRLHNAAGEVVETDGGGDGT